MMRLWLWLSLVSLVAAGERRPNILFILCDDLGYAATGPSGQNARSALRDPARPSFATPALDRFAASGMQLRAHYAAAPICASARASLLLGVTQGHANVRDNQFDKALADGLTIPSLLRHAGYATAAIGKWGLQGGPERDPEDGKTVAPGNPAEWSAFPTKRGFDFFLGYVRHVDGHFHYPKEDAREIWANEQEVARDLDLCYTTDLFTARAKRWIADHRDRSPEQPFFLYLAFDTPHAVLAYPASAYPTGSGLHGGLQWTGQPGAMINSARGARDSWCDPEMAHQTWDHDRDASTPEEPWPDVQKRSATAIRRIDAAVGDLLDLLRDLGVDDETLVVFTSDNGPTTESYLRGNPCDPAFFDTAGEFSGMKRDTLEGGLRVPTFVRWPGVIPAGEVETRPSGQWDWLATFAELAGVAIPASSDGVSLVPTLTGSSGQAPSLLYFEYAHRRRTPDSPEFAPLHRKRERRQMQTVHVRDYVGVRYDVANAGDPFEIYDLAADPWQAKDLSDRPGLAEVQAAMKARVLQVRRPDLTAPRPYDTALVPPVAADRILPGSIAVRDFTGKFPWVPNFRTLIPDVIGTAAQLAASDKRARGGVAFDGYFRAARDGVYRFHIDATRGAVLFLHEARVVVCAHSESATSGSGEIRLAAGWHPIRLYARDGGVECTYEGPGVARHIPAGDELGTLDTRNVSRDEKP